VSRATTTAEATRTCSRCGVTQPTSAFPRSPNCIAGRAWVCSPCDGERKRFAEQHPDLAEADRFVRMAPTQRRRSGCASSSRGVAPRASRPRPRSVEAATAPLRGEDGDQWRRALRWSRRHWLDGYVRGVETGSAAFFVPEAAFFVPEADDIAA
jgi:hypothetical protein